MKTKKKILIKICFIISVFFLLIPIMYELGGGIKEEKSSLMILNDALDSLGYDRYTFRDEENDRILLLEKFAQILYEENPIGVENISFKYFIQNVKAHNEKLSDEEFKYAVRILVDTEIYIIKYDIEMAEYEGTDYNNERYNPERIGKDLNNINKVYDYDFALIKEYEDKYSTIDRKRALAGIFYKICKGNESNLERQQKVGNFCSKISTHAYLQPINEEKQLVCDPIILLELHEMKCGQVARIACDLFSAVGYQTRLVQLGGHVIAEIYYDQAWHYFDVDLWHGYKAVENNGNIPSVEELSKSPYLIDAMNNTYYETYMYEINLLGNHSDSYPSYYYFNKSAYTVTPCYYYKIATEEQELNWYYGWNYYETVDAEIELSAEKFEQPAAPYIEKVIISEGKAKIEWSKKENDLSDIIGYKVFVSRTSRGWEYANICGDQEIENFVINRYEPSQYDKITQLPCSDVYDIDTSATEIELELENGIYYVSIMPYDSHGESVGRKIYLMSNELRIEIR